jgi:hypothetical protein
MPLRKLAGYTKTGEVWVNPNLQANIRARIRIHNKEFQKAREQGNSRTRSLRLARKTEHKGMTKHRIMVYEGTIGGLTKSLHGRMSYSPVRHKR